LTSCITNQEEEKEKKEILAVTVVHYVPKVGYSCFLTTLAYEDLFK